MSLAFVGTGCGRRLGESRRDRSGSLFAARGGKEEYQPQERGDGDRWEAYVNPMPARRAATTDDVSAEREHVLDGARSDAVEPTRVVV